MDAVTYPDAPVQEIAKSFVCIRVEFDQGPEIVKKHGVQPLPDVRLLDPDGRELAKLVGFSSAARLAEKCQAALDRLAGKEASGPAAAAEPRRVEATPEAIEGAVARGMAYVASSWRDARDAGPGMGPEPLVLLALAACGKGGGDPEVKDALAATLSTPLTGTYQTALRALAFSRSDLPGRQAELEACAKFLCETQLANGQWSYRRVEGAPPALGDHSNTAYAVLGLAACRAAGVEVPEARFEKAAAWWRSTQREDGGWGYRTDREKESYASMTESGLSCLLLCSKDPHDPAVERGMKWLQEHFSARTNSGSAYQEGRLVYHLYALERVGDLLGKEDLAGHDWYREGAAFLLGTQRDDGSWDDGADTPVVNTCLAILFLRRTTKGLRPR